MITLKRDRIFSAAFLAPAIIPYTVFVLIALSMTVFYSFFNYTGISEKVFAGLNNFTRIVKDESFWFVARNTAIFLFTALILEVGLGLVIAFLISKTATAFKFFRMTFFLPVVISSAATAVMFVYVFRGDGALNALLHFIGLGALQKSWLSNKNTVLYAVMAPEIWQQIGVYFIIMLAGIQSIPKDILESAQIDGAKSTRTLFSIVIPMMSEVIQVCVIFALTNIAKSINYSQIMTDGGPGISSSYLSIYTYRKIFSDFEYGYGSSIAVVVLILLLIFTVVFKRINNLANAK
jgi:raffinose/stachyose/melibiose transport system permease protein